MHVNKINPELNKVREEWFRKKEELSFRQELLLQELLPQVQ